MENQEERMTVGRHDVQKKKNNESEEVEFLGSSIISRPTATVGGIDLVAAIKARDTVDQLHDLQILWSKSAEDGGKMQSFRAFTEGKSKEDVLPQIERPAMLCHTTEHPFTSTGGQEGDLHSNLHVEGVSQGSMLLRAHEKKKEPLHLWKLQKSQRVDELGGEKETPLTGEACSKEEGADFKQLPSSQDMAGPSKVKRKRKLKKNGNWTNTQLKAALRAVDRGAKPCSAADYYGIPRTSFRGHLHGRTLSRKRGKSTVLTVDEEKELVKYLVEMADRGFPQTWLTLRIKVALMIQDRPTPFKEGIPGNGWVRWFQKRHPGISLRKAQPLEVARAKGLCPQNVATFYNNLQMLYEENKYEDSHIWNADESGAQAGRSGGARVLARTGVRNVHIITPNSREHLTALSCINAAGDSIPNYYVFKGKQYQNAHIARCEKGARMGMQENAWMTAFLFDKWMDHFVENLQTRGGVSTTNRHLLIVDGHNSHVTLTVIEKCRSLGIDLLTLPSHTSHALQPLDVSCFRSFKLAFRIYRDIWTEQNRGAKVTKVLLGEWVSNSLKRALTTTNIKSGFRATGIFPLNAHAMDNKFGPSTLLIDAEDDVDEEERYNEVMQEVLEEDTPAMEEPECIDYDIDETTSKHTSRGGQSDQHSSIEPPPNAADGSSQVQTQSTSQKQRIQPFIDYSMSLLLTDEKHIQKLKDLQEKKELAAQELEKKRLASEAAKKEREAFKKRKAAGQKEKGAERANEKRLKTYYAEQKKLGWGNNLQNLLKSGRTLPPLMYHAPYCGKVPPVCIWNQRVASLRLQFKREGKDPRSVIHSTSIPWARQSYSPYPPVV